VTLPTVAVEIGRLEGWTLGTSLLGTDTFLATYAYEEITPWVRSFTIRRGRQHELNRVETGTASVMAINQEGTFNATNTASPFYPDIRPMTPIRIRASYFGGPTDIAGLVAWYDFSDLTTLFQDTARTVPITADGQAIKGVTDKSGVGNHLSEATNGPSYKVAIQNSLSVARFDGTNDQLSATITADTSRTTFIVAKKTAAPSGVNKGLVGMGTASHIFYTNSVGHATSYLFFQNEAAGSTVLTGSTATAWTTVVARLNGLSSLDMYANGGTGVNVNPNDADVGGTAWAIGSRGAGSDPGDYDIAEVLIYNTPLVAADINSVGAFLASKWGLVWTDA
jgi:hypothetical protein